MWQHLVLVFVCHLATASVDRSLYVRSIPAVNGFSSSIYEVYMRPYSFAVGPVATRAQLRGSSEAEAELEMVQQSPPYGPVLVRANVTGLQPGLHRLFVTHLGDLREGCTTLRRRYSPYQVVTEPDLEADLGGVMVGEDGTAHVNLLVPVITLSGPRAVAGRAVVLQKDEDKGAAICGVLGYSKPELAHLRIAPTQPLLEPGEAASLSA